MTNNQEYYFNLSFGSENKVELYRDEVTFIADKNKKVISPCPYFKECGNCQLLEVD